MSAEELSFVRATLDRLSGQAVTYDDNFTTPAADRPRKPRLVEVRPPFVARARPPPVLRSAAQANCSAGLDVALLIRTSAR
jgi:hypothetical protein